jgi:nucleoside-diphosphate-sugar epimerase
VYRRTAQAIVEMASAAIARGFPALFTVRRWRAMAHLKLPFYPKDMSPVPTNLYELAKHAAELIVRSLSETYGGQFPIAIPHNIIGAR